MELIKIAKPKFSWNKVLNETLGVLNDLDQIGIIECLSKINPINSNKAFEFVSFKIPINNKNKILNTA